MFQVCGVTGGDRGGREMTMGRYGDWCCSASGRQFWPEDPRAEDIDIGDIAHALSNLCRFAGHCREFYSVAQHSVLVSLECDPEDALWGLLHDAPEAYIVDLPRPLKRSPAMEAYRRVEDLQVIAVCERFGLPLTPPPSVKRADNAVLAAEARDLMPPASVRRWHLPEAPVLRRVVPMSPTEAKRCFLSRFRTLTFGFDSPIVIAARAGE